MKMKQLASKISRLEGKRHQASIGDVREIIGLISEQLWIDSDTVAEMIRNGQRRAKRKAFGNG